MIYWWAVGLGHSFGCHVCSMFDSIDRGSKGRWLRVMIDFNRWSEMEVCDRSRFELCHLTGDSRCSFIKNFGR